MLLGLLLAPLGCAGVRAVGGRADRQGSFGYLDVQAGWGNGFDGGLAFARFIAGRFAGPAFPAGLGLLVGVAALVWLYVRCVRQRQPLPLLVYGGVVLVLALAAKGYFGSKPRLLIPAFPLLLPLATRPGPAASRQDRAGPGPRRARLRGIRGVLAERLGTAVIRPPG